MPSKCDICFDERCRDESMVRLVNMVDGKYTRCCCCNINICIRCSIGMHRSNSVKKCPLCRSSYEAIVFNNWVGTDRVSAFDANAIKNKFDRYRIVDIDGIRYAMKRSQKDEDCIDLYSFQSYNREKKELMMSFNDTDNSVGMFDISEGRLMLGVNN